MEMLETAGRSYLGGQSFSDDVDSHDETRPSPPKGGVAPCTSYAVSSSSSSASLVQNHADGGTSNKNPISRKEQLHHVRSTPNMSSTKGATAILTPTPSSPKAIPMAQQGGVSSERYQSPQKSGSGGPYSRGHQKQEFRSPNLKQQPQQHHASTTAPGSSPRTRGGGVMQHAASFDHSRTSQGLVRVPVQSYYGGSRSNSLFDTSPYSTSVGTRQFHSAQVPSRFHPVPAADVITDNSIVRKLFKSQPERSSSTTVSLQTLFSQAASIPNPMTLSSSTQSMLTQHSKPLVSALSLDEIERQLTEEAPPSAVPEEATPTKTDSAGGPPPRPKELAEVTVQASPATPTNCHVLLQVCSFAKFGQKGRLFGNIRFLSCNSQLWL